MSKVSRSDFELKVVQLDESMREIGSLAALYEELVSASPESKRDIAVKRDEAKFARERMLKLSLHAKNVLSKLESDETLK
jgi:hypothetical protein